MEERKVKLHVKTEVDSLEKGEEILSKLEFLLNEFEISIELLIDTTSHLFQVDSE